jgi:dipeptidyl aminopeptidase/acylaminoacyl peptidase
MSETTRLRPGHIWLITVPTIVTLSLLVGLGRVDVKAAQQGAGSKAPPSYEPEVAICAEDYGEVRKTFRTKLLRNRPSPQTEPMINPPAGVSVVEFASGRLHLKAWINAPGAGDSKKRPAVVFLHGGFGFGIPDWTMAQPYRDAGYVVLAPMLRGENGQKGAYTLFYDEVDDVLAASEYLLALPYVDSKRIFVAGHSVGGTLALLAAEASNRFRAVASFSASPDQILYCRYGIRPESIPFDLAQPRELEVRSPLAYAQSLKCPARFYYGKNEKHFEKTTQRMAAVAKQKGLDAEATAVEGNHMTAVPESMKLSIAFFEKQR